MNKLTSIILGLAALISALVVISQATRDFQDEVNEWEQRSTLTDRGPANTGVAEPSLMDEFDSIDLTAPDDYNPSGPQRWD